MLHLVSFSHTQTWGGYKLDKNILYWNYLSWLGKKPKVRNLGKPT